MEQNKYANIIWDWNGTLLNDVQLCVNIVNKLLDNHKDTQLDLESYKNVFGFPIRSYYQKIGVDFTKESFESLTVKFITAYESQVKNCQLQDNAAQVLGFYQTKGLGQYILTAAHKESVLSLLDHYAISPYFKQVEGLDNHKAESKIKRGVQLMQNNNIQKEKTVLIGDTIHDFEVSKELGIDCVLIARGHQSKKRLMEKTEGNVRVIDQINQLKGVV